MRPFLLPLTLLFAPVAITAQQGNVVEPEAIGVMHIITADSGLRPLPREIAKSGSKQRGLMAVVSYAELRGAKSAFRPEARRTFEFVIRLPAGIDPGKFRLYRWDVKANTRELILQEQGGVLRRVKSDPSVVLLQVTQYGPTSYKLTVSTELLPGEYGFSATDSQDVFTFGID